jgi:hypothetical protein
MASASARSEVQLCFAADPLRQRQRTARSLIYGDQIVQFRICDAREVLRHLCKGPAISNEYAGGNEFEELPIAVNSLLAVPLCAADDTSLSIVAEQADAGAPERV